MTDSKTENKHRNDIYGDFSKKKQEQDPPIPAATVVLLKDDDSSNVEVLMLRKNSKIAFGGMWVFPGGRIDDADQSENGDTLATARNAAVRESHEEAGIDLSSEEFVWFAHWTPPHTTARRFSTWFFAAHVKQDHVINIDGGEITDHKWISPEAALAQHAAGDIDLAPPTWITLYHLSRYAPSSSIIDHFKTNPEKIYVTTPAKRADGARVAMWQGDAGYESADADMEGDRHRLIMLKDGFVFENTIEKY
ncbi:MAG: NUDIX hydrolase [Pseudomonadales bacterium]|nr:NUDIX hydrolase [Pseudomonadales bacterium]